MKDRLIPFGWALALFLLAGCQQEMETEIATRVTPEEKQPESIYVPGTANILLDEETVAWIEQGMPATRASASFNEAVGEIGVTGLERIFPWYRVHFSPSVRKDRAADVLRQVKGVVAYEPVIKAKRMSYPFNDPKFSSQWQYHNEGTNTAWVAGADMQVIPVWKYYTTGSSTVGVTVVDGGIQLNHEDLVGNTDATNSYNFATKSTYITPDDHGTHVAGIIGAVNNNGIGVAGMAGGDAAEGLLGRGQRRFRKRHQMGSGPWCCPLQQQLGL